MISAPEVWQEIARAVLGQFGTLARVSSPAQALTMLQKCGDQQLKARLVETKEKGGTDPFEALREFRTLLMQPTQED